MRHTLLTTSVFVFVGLAGVLGQLADTARVTLQLIDAETGREIPGLVRITDADGNVHHPGELLNRGLGMPDKEPIVAWHVLPKRTVLALPKGVLTIEAIGGPEREAVRKTIDLSGRDEAEVALPLPRFSNLAASGWRSGNTHIHLMKVSRADCDRYLREVPPADHLDAVFVSHLERAGADHEYTTNTYTRADLAGIEKASGVKVGNGEEHRHNFDGFNQGYGHVMLLKINDLVQPVSIGPGITKMGTDGLPLQRGIDTARRDGATIVWCHSRWGMEQIANFATGRLRAMNIFDGGAHGSYKDCFYRYWDAGFPVSFSTGTDWFIYDFSRVYAQVDGDVTVDNWLAALKAGRTFITNGPLLKLQVRGKGPGEIIDVEKGGIQHVRASASGRIDFRRIELVRNGRVVGKAETKPVDGHYEAELSLFLDTREPCWIALRTPPPPVKDDPSLQEPVPRNEFGKDLFAHTTPIAIQVGGKAHFDRKVAETLLEELRKNAEFIAGNAKFADDAEKQRVLDVYQDGVEALTRHITAQGQRK
jgi:hypothetical protein